MNTSDAIPPGIALRYTLRGHKEEINQLSWSPDGRTLASGSFDKTVRIWDLETGQLQRMFTVPFSSVYSMAWSPNGRIIASGGINCLTLWDVETAKLCLEVENFHDAVSSITWSPDGQVLALGCDSSIVRLLDAKSGQLIGQLSGHTSDISSVAWSQDKLILASGSLDKTIRLWNMETKQAIQYFAGHTGRIHNIAWSPDGLKLASASSDRTIRIWNPKTGRSEDILEGHLDTVNCISFSFDGCLLASKSHDGTVWFWRTDTWERVAVLNEPHSNIWYAGLAFHIKEPVLATLSEQDRSIRIWDLDLATILGTPPTSPVHYINAKVVLVGDTGVGKSGLALALTNQPFVATDSTHSRHVWTFESQEVEQNGGRREMHEALLWDLAGQPGYRLIHQLHLEEVAIALVLFDARSETDPFAGVFHWNRALRQAQRIHGTSAPPMKKFLVAARIDRGGRGVSRARIEALLQELEFDGYFETSAKEGWGIKGLVEAIQKSIPWGMLPRVRSTGLFQEIKNFLIAEKEVGQLLPNIDELYRIFQMSSRTLAETGDLRAQFETCIGRVEARGLIRRLSFNNLVLLQPELLDVYASALVNAVKDEPDGVGSIYEYKAQNREFMIPEDDCLKDKKKEKMLLIAVVEDLLHHEIALREQADDGPYLIFPSQSTREMPNLPDPKGKAVIFEFEGPVINIYATLTVRIAHSGIFERQELWKNAVIYQAKAGGTCGIFLHNVGEGRGELTIFFEATSEETSFFFEEYVQIHLQRRALPESIRRQRIFVCTKCEEPFTNSQIDKRKKKGHEWIQCSVCDTQVSLLEREEKFKILTEKRLSRILEIDHAADAQRDREVKASVHQGLQFRYDVFLCHNNEDKLEVKRIGEMLKERDILPWLDEWELRPGLPWQRILEEQIERIKVAAVFIGKTGIGPWQQQEIEAFLREFVKRNCPVIPVLLPDATKKPKLPIFLTGMTWVDFSKPESDPLGRLIWGITGNRGVEQ